jgi:uncharacterized membrane protein YgcG
LRDALRADPAVVAALPDGARARLATRFEVTRSKDRTIETVTDDPMATPETRVAQLDRVRQRRQAEPLLLGVMAADAAWAIEGDSLPSGEVHLPPLEGARASTTAAIEARALAAHAGVELGLLLAASGAHRLERVVGWSVGAVAIDDTIYVNGAWLVALAPAELDGGVAIDGGVTVTGGARKPAPAGSGPSGSRPSAEPDPQAAIRNTPAPRHSTDAGTASPPTSTPQPSENADPATAELCNACAEGCASCDVQGCADNGGGDGSYDGTEDGTDDPCAASSDDSSDSCDSDSQTADDSCDSGSQSTGDSCDSGGGSMDGGGECQVGRVPRSKPSHTLAWMVAPLGYLTFRRRR